MCAAMLEEQRIRGDRSIVAYAYKIAVEYGLDKVSVRQAYKKLVKRVIKQTNDHELWTVGVYGKGKNYGRKKSVYLLVTRCF